MNMPEKNETRVPVVAPRVSALAREAAREDRREKIANAIAEVRDIVDARVREGRILSGEMIALNALALAIEELFNETLPP
jgi:hypothetical protein